ADRARQREVFRPGAGARSEGRGLLPHVHDAWRPALRRRSGARLGRLGGGDRRMGGEGQGARPPDRAEALRRRRRRDRRAQPAVVPVSAARGLLRLRQHRRRRELHLPAAVGGLLMRRVGIAALVLFAFVVAMPAVAIVPTPASAFDAANDAWERGDYIAALTGYIQLLGAPGGEKFIEPIALTTGELFETRELTGDGRAPRFSPDGRFIVYETGLETSRRTAILRNDATRAHVAELRGVSATFSPLMAQVAYLRIPDHEEIRRAS